MRSLWLASAATIFIAGAACAQTTGPAPTGAPNAATMSAPGQSPGNAGTNSGSMSAPSVPTNDNGGPSVGGSGVPNAAQVTPPGISPGKTKHAAGTMSGNMAAPAPMASPAPMGAATPVASTMMPAKPMTTTMHHHYYVHTAGMPASASTTTYLHIAKTSIMHHNKMMADEALSRAETIMLNRAVPAGGVMADTSPGVTSIEGARKALAAGDMKTALSDTNMAMGQGGGTGMSSDMGGSGMGGSGMGGSGMSSGSMGGSARASGMSDDTSSMHKPMSHSIYGNNVSGLPPGADATSDSAAVGGNAASAPNKAKPASAP